MFIEDTCVQPINFPATFTIWLVVFVPKADAPIPGNKRKSENRFNKSIITLSTLKKLSFWRKYNHCYPFLQIESVLTSNLSLLSIIVPRYLYWSTISMQFPFMYVGGGEQDWFLLKSMAIFFVFEMLSWRKDLSHQLTNSSTTGPCWDSFSCRKLTITVSSANFRMCLLICWLLQSLVWMIYSSGESTQPWGESVEECVNISVNIAGVNSVYTFF